MKSERYLKAAVKAAADEGDWARVRAIGALMTSANDIDEPITGVVRKTSTDRVRAWREANKAGKVQAETGIETGNETANETSCNALHETVSETRFTVSSVPPPSDSPLPELTFQSLNNSFSLSSPSGSLKEGSGLEERAKKSRRRRPETQCPGADETRETIDSWCVSNKVPLETQDARVSAFLNWHRREEKGRRNWAGAWGWWLTKDAEFARDRKLNGKHVQPNDPTAPWMNDDHGKW